MVLEQMVATAAAIWMVHQTGWLTFDEPAMARMFVSTPHLMLKRNSPHKSVGNWLGHKAAALMNGLMLL
jgi:hypothetical protein